MKKKLAILFIVFIGLASASFPSGKDLVEIYRQGIIRLTPDPDFGADIDWASLFFDRRTRLKVAPDGSVFVANQRENNIVKFDASGKFLLKFGKKGQGPGDLNFPAEMSILNDRYLVVAEYASSRRISLFEQDGTFHKLMITQYPPSSVIALQDNKIAYVGMSSDLDMSKGVPVLWTINRIIIVDVDTKEEMEVTNIRTSSNEWKDGRVYVGRSISGDLLVGHSIRPDVDVYGLDGEKKKGISLKITPIPVTKKIKDAYPHSMVVTVDGKAKEVDLPFAENLPYYRDMIVDSQGNLLVFLMTESPEEGPVIFQVYAPTGEFLCETEIAPGDFDLSFEMRHHENRLDFTKQGIFGILPLTGDELETPHLFKIKHY
jgi:hypothetical protein